MKTPLVPALLLCACTALTACTGDADRTPTATTASVEPSSAEPGPSPSVAPGSGTPGSGAGASASSAAGPVPTTTSGAPAFPADTTVDTEQPSGAPLTVVAVRAAGQDGYDRVVFELRGEGEAAGAPGWRVEYVDEARQDGSGDEVDVAGEETIAVFIEGVGLPFETGQQEASQDLTPRDTDRVREVDLQATFEGRFTAFIGTDQRVPFRVFRLADPARVVVDVRHS